MKRTIPHNKSLLLNTNEADSQSSQALCVGLSHKLICTNAFFGLLLLLLEKSHWLSRVISFSLMRGKCYLIIQITNRVTFHVSNPPFRTVILSYVNKKFESGRFIALITKAGQNYAVSVAGHLKIFSKILVSQRQTILSGTEKRAALKTRYDYRDFDYLACNPKHQSAFVSANVAPKYFNLFLF